MREISQTSREIGPLPLPADPGRRLACSLDPKLHLLTYHPTQFYLPFSTDQLELIEVGKKVILDGDLAAVAMPRGSGKTTICEGLAEWAIVNGHRRFAMLISSEAEMAKASLESIKRELETNDLLGEDYPEVQHPLQALEGIVNRAAGQILGGDRTHIRWKSDRITLPTVNLQTWLERRELARFVRPDGYSRSSGTSLRCAGITGQIRGTKIKTAGGDSIRPDLVLIDDPQSDMSAFSDTECRKRERIIAGAVLRLAGPGRKIAALAPCTVIRKEDVADNLLNRQRNPQWKGRRYKALYSLPEKMDLWDRYANLRQGSLMAGGDGAEATAFYSEHQKEMSAGAKVSWPERHNPDELDGLQHCMNKRIDDPRAFAAEDQNEPLPEVEEDVEQLTVDQICVKINKVKRGLCPPGCTAVTAFIDVQASALFWAAIAWEPDFTGYIVDYDIFPPQPRTHFRLRDVKRTLQSTLKIADMEAAIYKGLELVGGILIGKRWPRQGGGELGGLGTDKLIIDANWGDSTEVVYQYCRQFPAGQVLPWHGRGITAGALPMHEWAQKTGERRGVNWLISPSPKGTRKIMADTNFWKSFLMTRLRTPLGARSCLSLYGDRPLTHRLLAEHVTAEAPVNTSGRGRQLVEWKQKPNHPDNHWLDCVVGCCVAASTVGIKLAVLTGAKPRKRKTLGQMQAEARERREAA
jgi:hypothetical protein